MQTMRRRDYGRASHEVPAAQGCRIPQAVRVWRDVHGKRAAPSILLHRMQGALQESRQLAAHEQAPRHDPRSLRRDIRPARNLRARLLGVPTLRRADRQATEVPAPKSGNSRSHYPHIKGRQARAGKRPNGLPFMQLSEGQPHGCLAPNSRGPHERSPGKGCIRGSGW